MKTVSQIKTHLTRALSGALFGLLMVPATSLALTPPPPPLPPAPSSSGLIRYGTAQFYGAGCPAGTARFTPSPDHTEFSILFDNFTVSSGKATDYKYCSLVVPVRMKAGYRLQLNSMDVRGFLDIAEFSASQVGTTFQFVNRRSQATAAQWKTATEYGEYTDNFVESFDVSKSPPSFCGGETQWLVIHNFAAVYNWDVAAQKVNTVTLDSTDGAGQIKGRGRAVRCH